VIHLGDCGGETGQTVKELRTGKRVEPATYDAIGKWQFFHALAPGLERLWRSIVDSENFIK